MKVFRDDASRKIKSDDKYIEKFMKLIPSEIIALYITTAAVFPNDPVLLFWIFLICSILTPVYLMFGLGIKPRGSNNLIQIIVSSISFMIWVATMGGFFALMDNYDSKVPLLIMIFWTFVFETILSMKLPFEPSEAK